MTSMAPGGRILVLCNWVWTTVLVSLRAVYNADGVQQIFLTRLKTAPRGGCSCRHPSVLVTPGHP
jgi:hypothetical protein